MNFRKTISVVAIALGVSLIATWAITQELTTIEPDVDRPGGDYRSFELDGGNLTYCHNFCASDPQCKSYTYVRPGVQGAKARCYLKNVVATAYSNGCCVSGYRVQYKPGITGTFYQEWNYDRPGGDYNRFEMNSTDPGHCKDACVRDGACRAYTYVQPGVQGPRAVCYLKNVVPAPTPNTCCVSGVNPYG